MNRSKKRKIIFITVLIVVTGIFAFSSCNNNSTNTVVQNTAPQNTVSQSPATQNPIPQQVIETTSPTVAATVTTTNAITPVSTTQKQIPALRTGQTVSTQLFDFTINSVELSYRVEPKNPPDYYSYYEAKNNEVYIYINASVTNKSKNSIDCDEIYSVTADYDNGYTYRGFNIADDDDGDFTYASITDISPLQTRGVHYLISCPDIINKTSAPLFLTINMRSGEQYKYIIR